MAYALLLSKTFNASTSAATFTFTAFGATIPAGTLIDIGVGGNLDTRAGNANAKILTCNDNSAQAGLANIYIPIVPNPGGTTVGVIRVRCFTTRDILTGDTITVTVSGGTFSRRSGLLTAWSGASSSTSVDQTALQSARTASPVTMGPTAALAQAGVELALAMSGWRGGAVLSGFANSTGGYTAIAGASSGGTTPNTEINGAYKVSAGTAAETDVHTFTSIAAACGKLVVYRPGGYTEQIKAPTFTLLDNFNTGASQNLDGRTGWGVGGREITGDQSFKTDVTPTVAGVSNGTPASNLWASSLSADQEVCVTMGTPDTFYLLARCNTATAVVATGYVCDFFWDGGLEIRRVSGTVIATFPSETFQRPASGDSYCFQVIGSTLTAWRRASGGVWQVLTTVQDSTYTAAGFIGIVGESGTGVTFTDFGGGALASAPVNYPLSLSATAVGTASVRKNVTKTLTASATGTATLGKVAAHTYLVTLAATAVGTASVKKNITKNVTATAVGTASFSKTLALNRTLAATAVGTASVKKGIAKTVSTTAVGSASLTARTAYNRTLAATAVGTARLVVDYPVPAGGGGYGAEMKREFLDRYRPGYEARYSSRYKPTHRRQG